MKVGFDIDGTLTIWEGGSRLSRMVPTFLLKLLVLMIPRFSIINRLREFKRAGYAIFIASNRPEELLSITIFWLRFWKIPFDELFLLGFRAGAQGKAEVVVKHGLKMFHDNKPKVIYHLNMLGVPCQHV